MQTKTEKGALEQEHVIFHTDCACGIQYSLIRGEVGYTVFIDGGERGFCRLPDVARSFTHAVRVVMLLAENAVSPINAADVVEELLARDPSLFV